MTLKFADLAERCEQVETHCRPVSAVDMHFQKWLRLYIQSRPPGLPSFPHGCEYWLVPAELTEDAVNILSRQDRQCMYLSSRYMPQTACGSTSCPDGRYGVLLRMPKKPWIVASLELLKGRLISHMYPIILWATEPFCRWGIKTCPNCFSQNMTPFTFESAEEPPHHYCGACNSTWSPRES